MNTDDEPQRPTDLVTADEAAAIVGRRPQTIRHAVRIGALKGFKEGIGRTSRLWISLTDLRQVYPPKKRGPAKRVMFRLTDEQEREVLGFDRMSTSVQEGGEITRETALPRPREVKGVGEEHDD